MNRVLAPVPDPVIDPATTGRSATAWARLFRRALLTLAGAGVAGTALELAMIRHWNSPVEMIPWAVLAALAAGIAVAARRPSPWAVRAVRWLAIVVALTAVFGVARHVMANYDAAPLDVRYTVRWASMSTPSRWWAALTQSVGPSPTLAPLVLAQAAACLWLGTFAHD